jgi:hypothetical protein
MINSKLIKYFYNSQISDGKVNLGGLTYTSDYNESSDIINIYVSNPDNLSYNPHIIINFFETEIDFFTKLIPQQKSSGPSSFFYLKQYFKFYFDNGDKKSLYINRKDFRQMSNLVSNITRLKYDDFEAEVVSSFDYIKTYGDSNTVDITIKLINSYYDNEEVLTDERLTEILEFLYWEKDFSSYLDSRYGDVLDFVWDNPLVMEKEYMYITLNQRIYGFDNSNPIW